MNLTSSTPPVDGALPGAKPASATPAGTGADAFAAILAALASLGPPQQAQAQPARTAPAEGTMAESDSPGPAQTLDVAVSSPHAVTPVGEPGIFAPIEAPEEPAAEEAGEAAVTVPDPDPAPTQAPARVSERHVPDSENPAAIAYARTRLHQLVRAGVIEKLPEGDPTAAWRELSKNVAEIARGAGYSDPREFLAHGRVSSQPKTVPAPAPSTAQGAEIPIEVGAFRLPQHSNAAAVQPVGQLPAETAAPDTQSGTSTQPVQSVGQQTIHAETSTKTPDAPAPRPVAARLHDLAEKTEATIRVAVRGRHTDARITLRPPELGEVRITLRYEAGGVSAALSADSGKAVEVLAGASADLRRALEEQGVTVQSLDVKLADHNERREARPWQDGTAASQRLVSDSGEDEIEATLAPAARIPHGGQIDLLA